MTPQPLRSLLPLLDPFDAFILDQWGVLHNGTEVFSHALDAVERLLGAGKIIVTLSNSGRRERTTRQQMEALGLPVARFRANVTSGETAVAGLARGEIGGVRLPGRRAYLVCRHGDASVIEGTGIERVADPAAADFVLLSGIEGETRSLDDYLDELAPAMARRLPVVCTNPDRVAVTSSGPTLAPGGVAHAYGARAGLEPLFVGKPHRPVYDLCLRALPDVATSRVVAIGDSLEHDIQGARNAGLATVFCLEGIHGDAFDLAAGAAANIAAVEALGRTHGGVLPDYVMTRLSWSPEP